jgi:menaquinone-dependent protoporphyrinogen oxidase
MAMKRCPGCPSFMPGLAETLAARQGGTVKVLVAYASRHGATAGIADTVGTVLAEGGLVADVRPIAEVRTLSGYDAVVLGSALYMGQWLKPAREFADRHKDELASKALWLFSSGPIGDPPFPREVGPAVEKLAEALDARGHQVFSGKLDRGELGLVEELMTTALRAPEGDFRNWSAIREWARSIATELQASTSDETSKGAHEA